VLLNYLRFFTHDSNQQYHKYSPAPAFETMLDKLAKEIYANNHKYTVAIKISQ